MFRCCFCGCGLVFFLSENTFSLPLLLKAIFPCVELQVDSFAFRNFRRVALPSSHLSSSQWERVTSSPCFLCAQGFR